MKMILAAQMKKLVANGEATDAGGDGNHVPVVKFFAPWGAATWLITEVYPDNHDIAFGLCDLGFGTPELGTIYLPELFALRGPLGLKIERDMHFDPKGKTISEFADDARKAGHIAA